MIKTLLIWVCGLVCAVVFASSALADQSIGYKEYFNKGVKAFNDHDDQTAIRCFKIAEIYDPTDEKVLEYLSILDKRGVVISVSFSKPPERSIGYLYYRKAAIKAFQLGDYKNADRYFKIARIFNPAAKGLQYYLDLLAQRKQVLLLPTAPVEAVTPQPQTYLPPVSQPALPPEVSAVAVPQALPQAQASSYPAVEQPQPVPAAAVAPQPAIYISPSNIKQPINTLSLAQITNNGQIKPKIQIELHSSVIFEGRNIRNFLMVDQGFIGVRTLDSNRLEVDALRIGSTFLHIWDDSGRQTLYIEIVFPKTVTAASLAALNAVQHAQPFVVTYANDWSTYYLGQNISQLKRQSNDFNESLSVTGETPYGLLDASGSYQDFDAMSQFDTYTVGLSQIPLEGTDNFNLRGFDAFRYTSPLTMPGTRLRGAFADVDLLDDNLGLSVSHGQQQVPLGFISQGENQFLHSYIDALKLTLFPKSQTDQYSFNYATAYGPDRSLESYLTNHVYSIQGQHKFNDFLTLNAEGANDSSHDSELASLKWQQGNFMSGLNFRNIDKDYSTISTLPDNQGETGASWVTEGDYKNYSMNTFLEAYQDHLYSNPDDPRAFNYDASGHLRSDLSPNVWSDSDLNFVDNPGELSPQRNFSINERLSRSFGIWNAQKGTVFGGVGYQNSHAPDSPISDYDKEDVIVGVQLPITNHVSTYINDEFDWLNQPDVNGKSNPDVINAGVEYQKQFNPRFSVTSQVVYRDELGVNGTDSLLSGQESVILSSSFNYNPTPDMSFFADGDASRVLSHVGNLPYDDFEVHVGMRLTFGGTTYWDPSGTVSGIVFKDRNGDGKFGPGDEGIADVKIKVGDKEVTTDKNGHYSVQIRAKGVQVVPVLDTLPGGFLFSTPQALNVTIIQGRASHADFGLTSQTGIYGIVFVDKNGSGIPSDTTKFIGKVRVVLDGKTIEKSDNHGAFYFRKVSPGVHTITLDINSLSLDMLPKVKLINKIDVAEGTNYMFNIPVQVKAAINENQ